MSGVKRVIFFYSLKESLLKHLNVWEEKNRDCVPKDRFPTLLRMTLDRLPNVKQNLIGGFVASEIRPFDSTQVLKSLPS